MSDIRIENIIDKEVSQEMSESYVTYAMQVIVSRALPDIRDGLKPSQRRILYAMKDLGLYPNKKHRKCAKIAGDTSGNYHPHGEQVIYPTLVRMVQSFSLRYPLINGQGNFGSIDGDAPAAMRYTEAKMTHSAHFMVHDIDKETVDFLPNYDNTLMEPSILPSKFPNLLCNGSTGIAVGMATNIPPHNIQDVVRCINHYLEDSEVEIEDLIQDIGAPDFPTGGIIYGMSQVVQAYKTGRGTFKIRARVNIEQAEQGKQRIVVTEIPYQVNKSNLIDGIVQLISDKVIGGVVAFRDESDKRGLRIVLEVKKDGNVDLILNQLYKHSQLEISYGVNNVALVNGESKLLNLKEFVHYFVEHRKEVITRKARYNLDKAVRKLDILKALLICLDFIDEVIAIIRGSKESLEAKNKLIDRFEFTDIQAQAILEMQLQRLTGMEKSKIQKEHDDLLVVIEDLRDILSNESRVLQIIKEDLQEVLDRNIDERRTEIVFDAINFDDEDLIKKEDLSVVLTESGYIRALSIEGYRKQNRGGKGVTGVGTKDNDIPKDIFVTNTHQYILFCTNKGRIYWAKGYQIPRGGRTSKGKAIVNMLALESNEFVQKCIPIKSFNEDIDLVFFSKKGLVKKTALEKYSQPRKKGIIALKIEEGDELIDVHVCHGVEDVIVATKLGMAVQFCINDVRRMGRTAKGVKAITLGGGDLVVGAISSDTKKDFLTITEKGYGKKTSTTKYRLQKRGGKGVKNMRVTKKSGEVVAVLGVEKNEEVIVLTQNSMVMRFSESDVRSIARNTMGVKIMRIDDKDMVKSVAKISVDTLNEE